MFRKTFGLITLLLMLSSTLMAGQPSSWTDVVRQHLPLLGHRNWIVIVDSAYPLQVAPGIETVYAPGNQLTVVSEVLNALGKTRHVKPTIYIDAELKHVAEADAPGVGDYRDGLKEVLKGLSPEVLPHEAIIRKLDEAGKTFKVLVIKTPLTIPYTSVFLQLECGYWNAEAEQRLRDAVQAQKQ